MKKKYFFTMGQCHTHEVHGQNIDQDTAVVIEAESHAIARKIAFGHFGAKFCTSYSEEDWTDDMMKYFPKGYVFIKEEE